MALWAPQALGMLVWSYRILFNVTDVRYWHVQVVGDTAFAEALENLEKVRNEYVVRIRGTLRLRKDPNPRLPTGNFELVAEEVIPGYSWLLALVCWHSKSSHVRLFPYWNFAYDLAVFSGIKFAGHTFAECQIWVDVYVFALCAACHHISCSGGAACISGKCKAGRDIQKWNGLKAPWICHTWHMQMCSEIGNSSGKWFDAIDMVGLGVYGS
jgi:hypothetical protein